MKHLVWGPAVEEELPAGSVAYRWCDAGGLNCEDVVAAIVPDDFVTPGTVRFDSAVGVLPKPLVHTFAGW